MENTREDTLIAYTSENYPNLSFPKRKRRKTFKMMQEIVEIDGTDRPKRVDICTRNERISCKRKRKIRNDLQRQVEIKSSVIERAEEVQANLNTKFPSFVKPMIRSNVSGGYWLSLPRLFCKLHLPGCDRNIVLVDESLEEFNTKYLPFRNGLSGGWRGFSIAHNLEEGDVLVFHLVGVCKMKVYIVRANHFCAVDAALSLLHFQAHAKVHEKPSIHTISQEMLRAFLGKCTRNFNSRLGNNDTQNIIKSSTLLQMDLSSRPQRWPTQFASLMPPNMILHFVTRDQHLDTSRSF